jgi:hypothetical protein
MTMISGGTIQTGTQVLIPEGVYGFVRLGVVTGWNMYKRMWTVQFLDDPDVSGSLPGRFLIADPE